MFEMLFCLVYSQNKITTAGVSMPAIIKLSPDATVTLTVTANDVNPPTDPFVQFELPDGRIVSFQSNVLIQKLHKG